MAIYKNFSGNQTNAVLIPKNGVRSGSISTVLITNKHDSTTMTTTLDLHDVSFNVREFSLRLTTTGGVDCTIVIK